ncbi:protein ROS1-like isoform X2 [Asparagus officinalis]|uniref:protein ROS1-like isoform X2 n=1 Tax=Asparagus officinalis TaxID=4686 RepID=UPI00098E2734|nr:protein ROS1-like isoform X2 [Asparagus officinalis]
MEVPKDFGNRGQWVPVTPAKPIPLKGPPAPTPVILNPNWFNSGVANADSGELRTLLFHGEGITQMPYTRLLATNDPAIMRQMNVAPIMIGRIGRSNQEMNAEFLNQNRLMVNGRNSSLPPLAPKPQYRMSFPYLPNLNLLPDNNTASRVVNDLMNYPAPPATMEKNQMERIKDLGSVSNVASFQDLLWNESGKLQQTTVDKPHEVIDLDLNDETTSFQDLLMNGSGRFSPFAAEKPAEQSFSNQVDCSQVVTSQNQLEERNVVANSSEETIVQQADGENQGIDLNKTPQNKPKRRKYTPKVIREGKPARAPRKPATPKPPKSVENPSGKRKYVRKNKGESPLEKETPTNAPENIADQDSSSRKKPVRRSLNFDLAESQAAEDQLTGLRKETVVSSQGQDSVVLESSIDHGIEFSLNSSMNPSGNENLRVPQTPNQPPQPSRLEMMKMKWQADYEKMVNDMNSSSQQPARREGENLKKLARMMNCRNIQGNEVRNSHVAQVPVASNGSSDLLLQVGNGDYNRISRTNGNCNVNYTDTHKRRRVENDQNESTHNASSMSSCPPSSGCKPIHTMQTTSFTFADAQRLMAHGRMQSSKHTLTFDYYERQASYKQVQDQIPILSPTMNSNQPPTPEKTSIYSNNCQANEVYGPKARVEVLTEKQTKPKARRQKKKEKEHLVNSMATNVQTRVLVQYGDPLEEIVQRLKHLDINGSDGVVVAIQPQNALVPYAGGSGAIVPFDDNLIKKRKPRPKVDLDPESDRVWRLLMGKESGEGKGTNIDKEKWWEEERRIFRGRADSFIARMHLIQGDRRFSKWKGSVVDSVIGVFLTQNVSDHLSSSAFMCLAARYPPRLKDNNRSANVETISRSIEEVSEPEICGQSSSSPKQPVQMHNKEMAPSNESLESDNVGSSILDFHEIGLGLGHESPDSVLGTAITVTSCTSAVEGDDKKSSDDVVSSQNSAASSHSSSELPAQTTEQFKPSPSLNSEADELLTRRRGNGVSSFRELLEMADGRVLNNLKATGNEGMLSADHSGFIDWSSLCGTASYSYQNFSSSGSLRTERSDVFINDYNQSNLHPSAFGLNQRTINETTNGQFGAYTESSTSVKAAPHAEVHLETTHQAVQTPQPYSNLHNDNQRNNLVAGGVAESKLRNEANTSQKVSSETLNKESKVKNGKIESEKKTYDWDSLRKKVQKDGAKKERSSDAMDSLDYEALRNADVNEISNAIRERGMNNMLAERIKDFLNRLVQDHGSIDLEWLRDIPPDKAKDYLLSIRGLGLKSVECVRLLTLHHLAFPVDTNVGRIAVRLGWVPLQPLPESLQLHLLEMYPILETIQKYLWPRLCKLDQRTLYELHYQLITFGKVFCTKSKPNCNACPMRGECKHFASAFASARLALPGPEEKRMVSSTIPVSSTRSYGSVPVPLSLPQLEGITHSREQTASGNCEPIIEEPSSPEPEFIETTEIDIEDAFYNDPDEIPTIKLNFEEFTQNLQNYMDGDMSKALVAITPEAASIPMPKLKNVNRLRTEHLVYELPDSHPLLEGLEKREVDDPCPYLLAIWTPGETAQSIEPPTACCNSQDAGKLCNRNTCFSCNSIREAQAQTVRGTLLIPCRTANRGSFPLNGTYFQVNEVFADHDSSRNPIDVPRDWIWNLPRRTVYFGTSIPSIFKGLTTEGIQHCFWRGFVCVRGFDRTARAPRPLFARLHFPASKVTRTKKPGAGAASEEKKA